MFKKILGTGATRILNLLIGFANMMLGAKILGAAEWGIGYMVVVDVSFLLIGVELLAGSGLVYFTPRKKLSTLMLVSYSWIIIAITLYALVFWLLSYFPDTFDNIVPHGYAKITLLMVLVYSFHNFNLNIFLGKEKVHLYNWVFSIQILTQITVMCVLLFVFHITDAHAFIYSLMSGYSVAAIVGFCFLLPMVKKEGFDSIKVTAKEMFSYGAIIQLSTLVSTLNKRLSMFLLKQHWGDERVGVFSSGTQITEGVKIIGNSLALVQFSALSNMTDRKEAVKLTLRFIKIAVVFTILALAIIVLMPTSFYEWVLSKEFSEIKHVMLYMSPGIIFLAAHTILAHYFSGTGQPKYNLYASLTGLCFTIPSTLLLVKPFGIDGAAISSSITFAASFTYHWIIFRKQSSLRLADLIPNKNDWEWAKNELKNVFRAK